MKTKIPLKINNKKFFIGMRDIAKTVKKSRKIDIRIPIEEIGESESKKQHRGIEPAIAVSLIVLLVGLTLFVWQKFLN